MMQGHMRLLDLVTYYNIVDPLVKSHIGSVHIDLRLGYTLKRYTSDIDLLSIPTTEEIMLDERGYILKPGDFILGATLEKVAIPLGYYGFIETKGNISRAGLSTHNTDGHIDPGFKGSLTLEIKNQSNVNVTIYPCIKFVQLFLWRVEGEMYPYNGKYQNSEGPTQFYPDDTLAIVPRKHPLQTADVFVEK